MQPALHHGVRRLLKAVSLGSKRRINPLRRRFWVNSGLAALLLFTSLLVLWPSLASCESTVGTKLWENSGLAVTRDAQGKVRLWSIADSGNRPYVYNVDFKGTIIEEIEVQGACNDDWEDLATDGQSRLFIPDFGNNKRDRSVLRVYEVDLKNVVDPAGAGAQKQGRKRFGKNAKKSKKGKNAKKPKKGKDNRAVVPSKVFYYRYFTADGQYYPEQNAESLIWLAGHLYVLSKQRDPKESHLFRIVRDRSELQAFQQHIRKSANSSYERFEGSALRPYPAKYLHTVELARNEEVFAFRRLATAADIDEHAQSLAILTYDQVLIYSDPSLPAWNRSQIRSAKAADQRIMHLLQQTPRRVTLPLLTTGQCEGLLWFEDDWWVSNEGGKIWPLLHSMRIKHATPM